jgi:hypothetical protein
VSFAPVYKDRQWKATQIWRNPQLPLPQGNRMSATSFDPASLHRGNILKNEGHALTSLVESERSLLPQPVGQASAVLRIDPL